MRAQPAVGQQLELIVQYMRDKIGRDFDPGLCAGFAVLADDGDFVAAVVISNYRGIDCEISCASETGAAWRPSVCRAVFSYIFEQLGCVRCTSITTKRNRHAREFLEALGFVLEGNLRLGYDGTKDALIYGLLAVECRHLSEAGGLHGEEVRTEAAARTGPGSDGERAGGSEQDECGGAGEPEPHQPVHTAGVD